jgi:hypothetical protein
VSRISAFLRQEYFVPDVSRAGLITLALIVPLVVSHVLGNAGAGIFVAITAQLVTSAKLDGTYPERALILLVATLALAGAAFAGTLAGASALTAVVFIGVVAGLASFARGIGDYGQLFGISAVILFLISLHAPHTVEAGLLRGTLVLAGGAWASVLVLFRWPFRPNLPFYLALARPWYYSSRLMESVARELATGPDQEAALHEDEGQRPQGAQRGVALAAQKTQGHGPPPQGCPQAGPGVVAVRGHGPGPARRNRGGIRPGTFVAEPAPRADGRPGPYGRGPGRYQRHGCAPPGCATAGPKRP